MNRLALRDAALALAAGALASIRSTDSIATSDSAFHLLRVGSRLLTGSFAGYEMPPGGEGAPLLGALFVAWLGGLRGGAEQMILFPGLVAHGVATAAVTWTLLRTTDRFSAIFGAALLVLPPAFASAFTAHPEQGLAGALLALAAAAVLTGRGPAAPLALGSLAALCSPVGIPFTAMLALNRRDGDRISIRSLLVPLALIATVAIVSSRLAAGTRGEILRGLLDGWGAPGAGLSSTLGTLVPVWGAGLLLLVPALFPWLPPRRTGDAPWPVWAPWMASVVATIALTAPGGFREQTAALAPVTVLLLALVAYDAARSAPDRETGRVPLLLLFIPVTMLIVGNAPDRDHRRQVRGESSRLAQVGQFLAQDLGRRGSVAAERTGALAALSGLPVSSLRSVSEPHDEELFVFLAPTRPTTEREAALLADGSFLFEYAPYLFRRGASRAFQDGIWIRRRAPVARSPLPAEYAPELSLGWSSHAAGRREEARTHFENAARIEPPGIGLAHEWLGILQELLGDSTEVAFREARRRDPTTARARGHLADRAISRGRTARADSLIGEALAYNVHEAGLWATRARLDAALGQVDHARDGATHALTLEPTNVRLIANLGSLLWRAGDEADALRLWDRAIEMDSNMLLYLGDYRAARPGAPPPPLLPAFSLTDFAPPPSAAADRAGR